MEQIRKTKIICTLGPASDTPEMMEKLMKAGMNVARFNFSHGDHEEQLGKLKTLRSVREKLKLPVAALLDTKGPEIRLKDFADGLIELEEGHSFTLTARDIMGNQNEVAFTYTDLPNDVATGSHILIDDGLVELQVKEIKNGTDIVCTYRGGPGLLIFVR